MKILVFILLLSIILYANIDIDKCKILNSPGNYLISKDIDASVYPNYISVSDGSGVSFSACIYINSSDMTIDCQNHSIVGRLGIDGVIMTDPKGLANLLIKNCNIKNGPGISLQSTANVTIQNLNVADAGWAIALENSKNTKILKSTFNKIRRAIGAYGAQTTYISNSKSTNGEVGFYLEDSTDLTLENNEASNNSETGFYITSKSKLNTVILKNNKANFNKEGFKLESITNVVFENNEAKNNSGEGIIFNQVDNLKLDSVLSSGNSAGIRVSGPSKEVSINNVTSLYNRFLGISTYQIEKLKLENILSCGNKLNDTSLKESTYSKSKITCDKSNSPGLCDYSCPGEIPANSSTNLIPIPDQKGCLGSVLLFGLFLLIFRRGY